MSKYIDAEKLKADIERYKQGAAIARFDNAGENADYFQGKIALCDDLMHIIVSLQHEQPDVELEKELREYFEGWRINYYSETEELLKSNGCTVDIDDVKEIARHFAEWGAIHLNARKEENK